MSSNSSNFEALVDEVRGLYDGGSRHLLVDLTDLTYLASSGLVALTSIVRIMRGEPPLDPEAGWGALHSMGLDVVERLDPDGGAAGRPRNRASSASSSARGSTACS